MVVIKSYSMALKVINGFKRYGDGVTILHNLNMTVGQGEIYGLLGASGCGKTTLLSCIVGLRKLDEGEITVLGKQRQGSVGGLCGYMPQDIALLEAATIEEILTYFGRIYGMTSREIVAQIHFLTEFLDLPEIHRTVQNLSGGEKRRISLATVIIHSPGLLILDEPTVGLDPVLRQRIWNHLFQISYLHGTTIIISTHYVEETRRCDKVGFLRGGQLLTEANPEALLLKFNAQTLEEVTFKLCRKDEFTHNAGESNGLDSGHMELVEIKSYRKLSVPQQEESRQYHLQSIAKINHSSIITALLLKWWNRHRRDWRLFIAEFVLPILILFVYQNVVGLTPHSLNVGVIMNNGGDIIDYCKTNTRGTECLENVGVCNFIENFDVGEFNWINANSYADGLQKIKDGRTIALIEFPPHFANHTTDRILQRTLADNESILGSTITIRMDETNVVTSSFMRLSIVEKYLQFLKNIVTNCYFNGEIVRPALKFNIIHGNADIGSWVSFVQPATVIMLLFNASTGLAVFWVEDRSRGLEDRDFAAGVKMWHRMLTSLLTQSFLTLALIVSFFALLYGVYSMEIKGSWYLAFGIAYIASMSGVAIGWMIATLRDNILENIVIIMLITLLQCYSSGLLFPIEMGSSIYRLFSERLPATYMIDAFRSICTRGWGLTHYVVTRGFLTGLGWIVFSIVVCLLVERKRYR